MSSNDIKCPNCGHHFPVEEALSNQAEEKIRKEYEAKVSAQASIYKEKENLLIKQQQDFEEKKKKENELFKQKLAQEKQKLAQEISKNTLEQFNEKIKFLEEENAKKNSENKKLRELEVSILKKEQDLQEQKAKFELEAEKKMLQKREEIILEVKKLEEEKNDLRMKEYEKKFQDQKKLIEEMKRKAEQGSMQMQGEVQELALENMLQQSYPFDQIEEVKKGVQGADTIQVVRNSLQQNCGKIIYESKRTKAFSEQWIEKLKADQRNEGAELAVLVTQTKPKDMEKFGLRNGVWVCDYQEVKSLSFVLREMLIKTQTIKSSQENKGDKMELLYNYLTGEEFKQRIEAIVDGFTTMKTDLDKEKRAMQKIWKTRETQIEKVVGNTIDMYGAMKGIAGNAISSVPSLELPFDEEEEL